MLHLAVCSILSSLIMSVTAQQYELIQTYTPANFFDEFTFFSNPDPTSGFVQYVPFETAAVLGLVGNASDEVYLGVDHTNIYTPGGLGRPSVRLESKLTFTEGLFVVDLSHIPTGCGSWPAFWTVGLGDWPADGEIDIIENTNDAPTNNAALHAAGECDVEATPAQSSTWKSTDCNNVHDDNQGCGTEFTEPNSYGETFNLNGGGVYAMEWTSSIIKIWFFPPTNIPESLSSAAAFIPSYSHPNTSTFGPPSASFSGPCSSSFGDKFFNHTIVFGTTFCGGWASSNFGMGDSQCPLLPGASPQDSCINYVGNSPEAFNETYWGIRSLRVWQKVPSFATEFFGDQTGSPLTAPEVAQMPKISAEVKMPMPTPEVHSTALVGNPAGAKADTPQNTRPQPDSFEVSPLTGGVLISDKDDAKPFPIPIDPGIGDGTLPEAPELALLPDTQSMWNTEGKTDDAASSTSLDPQVPVSEVLEPAEEIPPALTVLPAIASLWSTLQGDAQGQLLALANALAVGEDIPSYASAPPIEQSVESLAPSETPTNDTSTSDAPTNLLKNVGEPANELPTLINLPKDTVAVGVVEQLPDGPPIPALEPEDTSQAVGGIFGILDESTKNQLLSLLVSAQSPIDIFHDDNEVAGGTVSTLERHPKEYPSWCQYAFEKANPQAASSTWFKKLTRDYYIFSLIYESASFEDQKHFAQMLVDNVEPPDTIFKNPCEGLSRAGPPTWIRQFARDYRTYLDIMVGATEAEREEISKLIGESSEGSGIFRRITVAEDDDSIDAQWDALDESIKERLRDFGSYIASIASASSENQSNDDEFIKTLLSAVQNLIQSSSIGDKFEMLSLLTTSPSKGARKVTNRLLRRQVQIGESEHKNITSNGTTVLQEAKLKETVAELNRRPFPNDIDRDGRPRRAGYPGGYRPTRPYRPYRPDYPDRPYESHRPTYPRPPHYPHFPKYAHYRPNYDGLTWKEIYHSLDPWSRHYVDKFLGLYIKYQGQKPDVTHNLDPYIDYIQGWQKDYDSLDQETQAALLQWIIDFKNGKTGRYRQYRARDYDEGYPESWHDWYVAQLDEMSASWDALKSESDDYPISQRQGPPRPEQKGGFNHKQAPPASLPPPPPPRKHQRPPPPPDNRRPPPSHSEPSYIDALDDEEPQSLENSLDGPDPEVYDDLQEVANAEGYPWSKGPKKPSGYPWSHSPISADKKITDTYNDLALWDSLPDGAKHGILDTLAPGEDEIERRQAKDEFEGEFDGDSAPMARPQRGGDEDEDEDEPSTNEIVQSLKEVVTELGSIIEKYLEGEQREDPLAHGDENARPGAGEGEEREETDKEERPSRRPSRNGSERGRGRGNRSGRGGRGGRDRGNVESEEEDEEQG